MGANHLHGMTQVLTVHLNPLSEVGSLLDDRTTASHSVAGQIHKAVGHGLKVCGVLFKTM